MDTVPEPTCATCHAVLRWHNITPRETQVLIGLTLGKTNGEIAHELMVETGTVKTHVANILNKLHATTRTGAAIQYVLRADEPVVVERGVVLCPTCGQATPRGGLTVAELAVLRELAWGYSNATISRVLHVSIKTVKGELTRIFVKFGVDSRVAALVEGQRRGLVAIT